MERVEFRTVFAGVRPARVAVLLDQDDPGWQDTCRRVIECLSSTWGGKHSVIIPTDRSKIDAVFWDILEAFDPDYIFEYCRTGLDLKIALPQQYEDLLQHYLGQASDGQDPPVGVREQLDRRLAEAPVSAFGIAPELHKELKVRLGPFFSEETVIRHSFATRLEPGYPLTALSVILRHCPHPDRLVVTETNVDGIPPLWVESVLGGTYQQQTERIQACGVRIEHSAFRPEDVFQFIVSQLDRDTGTQSAYLASSPFQFSMAALSEYRSVSERSWELPAVVVAGATFQDFALYFDLSRMRPGVCWLLPAWLDTFKAAALRARSGGEPVQPSEGHARGLADALLHKMSLRRPRSIDFVSTSLDGDRLNGLIEDLDGISTPLARGVTIKSQGRVRGGIRDLLSDPRVVFNTDNHAVPTTQQVLEGKVAGFFPTPKPKGFATILPSEHHWITELRVDGLAYPRHPMLGDWLIRHHLLGTEEARSGKQGLCYFCPSVAYFGGDIDTILIRPEIFVPQTEQVFQRLATSAGVSCKLSDKGFFSRDIVLKMGGLEFAAALVREPRHFAVLQEYLKDGKCKVAKGLYLASDRRRYLRLPDITVLLGSQTEAVELIDMLVHRRILRRGTVLKCQYCRTADWFSLRDLADEFNCKRCRRKQAILSAHFLREPEPVWHYQLDEVAYQGIRNDMHVPLLALDYMRKKDSRFSYADELEIYKQSSPRPFIEMDLCCICEGTLTIGEAKTTERIEGGGKRERRCLAKYREAALLLGARRFVLATPISWTDETLANAMRAFADTNIEVVPLVGTQILGG